MSMNYTKNKDNFMVCEKPLYEFSGEGEFVVAHIKKQNLSTWEALEIISSHIGVKARELGYCGLKDKQATTQQYISVPRKFETALAQFSHTNLQILDTTYHNNKLRIGHLKGNHFTIILPPSEDFTQLEQNLLWIDKLGMPNYFGSQRFGNTDDNYALGKDILEGKKKLRDKKKSNFFISAYQSHLFNQWLQTRIKYSQDNPPATDSTHPFAILEGDVLMHYPYGRLFLAADLEAESKRFFEKDISPTGLLVGNKATLAESKAWELEKLIHQSFDVKVQGARRYAWIFPQDVKIEQTGENIKLEFYLPKGSYATVLLEQIGIVVGWVN